MLKGFLKAAMKAREEQARKFVLSHYAHLMDKETFQEFNRNA